MAEEVLEKEKEKKNKNILSRVKSRLTNVDQIINQMYVSMYGVDGKDDSDRLNNIFNNIMTKEVDRITGHGVNDHTTFLGKLYMSDKDTQATIRTINSKLNLDSASGAINPSQFISQKYKNRMLKQADAHQIANTLIELKEAKSTMRDAILSADLNTGRMNREISFETAAINDISDNYNPIIEMMENKFDLQKKIKDFIVDNLLDYGEYYVYTIPYHELFEDFASRYRDKLSNIGAKAAGFFECFYESQYPGDEPIISQYIAESADEDLSDVATSINESFNFDKASKDFKELNKEIDTLYKERISITISNLPIPIMEEGLEAFIEMKEMFTEDGKLDDAFDYFKKKNGVKLDTDEDAFIRKYKSSDYSDDGTYGTENEAKEKFEDLKDVYIKMVQPTHMIPVEIMGQVLFYIYIQTEDATPLNNILSYTNTLKTRDPGNYIDSLIEDIASRIVKKFDKKFVSENKEFRKTIVAALQYYDMGNTKIHFQVIPKEYVTAFKIKTDTNGHGHSMLEDSLFYAKMYLMYFLFKMISTVTKSNDQEINYIKTSGIEKNIYNKTQDIVRQKRSRQITINDMFSYTGMVNKIGAGSAIYMPVGKNNEKPLETEVISGQDVQINNDFMEMLRNNYILGTGVPSAIMNYLNEADFAKSIETANTKMNGRVINYQIDINGSLTELYQKLLKFSTNMPEEVIRSVRITLPLPKGTANIVQQELMNNYTSMQEFLSKLYFGDQPEDELHLQMFLKEVAKYNLSMLRFDQFDEIFERTRLESIQERFKSDDDDDLGDDDGGGNGGAY